MKIVRNEDNIMLVLTEKENANTNLVAANAVDASFEKHVPQYEITDNKVRVYVNHVMEEAHYIEWIMIDYGNEQIIKHFSPGDEPSLEVDYREGMVAYSYCNKHSLWGNNNITNNI